MKALVTGHLGFVGRHLVEALEADGYEVTGIEDGGTGNSDAVWHFQTQNSYFDVVYHCAAFVNGREGIDGSPAYMHSYNTMLDAAMFTWALRNRPGRVVYFSSSAAYPYYHQSGRFSAPLHEDLIDLAMPGAPEATYGLSKLHGEQMAVDVRADGVPVTVLRPFSGYGADQDPRYPFRAFLDRARARQVPFEVWGDGTQVRDWIHITDLVGAAIAAVEHGVDGPVNVCTGIGTAFHELADLFCCMAQHQSYLKFLTDKPAGVGYRVGDPTRLHEFYTPKVSIERGVSDALAT